MDYRYYNYFTEIEEYFVRLRGKHLLVSPMDWALIESWKQMEIPLHVVFRGIDSAFENRKGRRGGARINSIFYCQQAVMGCFEAYQQAMVGQADSSAGGDSPAPPAKAREGIAGLQADLERAAPQFPDPEAVQRVLSMLFQIGQELLSATAPTMPAVEASLQACDRILIEAGRAHLPADTAEAMEKGAALQLKIYKRRVSAEMYQRIRDNVLRRKVREHYGLPEFTLFSLE